MPGYPKVFDIRQLGYLWRFEVRPVAFRPHLATGSAFSVTTVITLPPIDDLSSHLWVFKYFSSEQLIDFYAVAQHDMNNHGNKT